MRAFEAEFPVFRDDRAVIIGCDDNGVYIRFGVKGDGEWAWSRINLTPHEVLFIVDMLTSYVNAKRSDGSFYEMAGANRR